MTKFVELSDAAAKVKDGDLIAIGGNNDHAPMAMVREIVRQGTTGLRLVFVPAGGINGDMLMGAGSANCLPAGGGGWRTCRRPLVPRPSSRAGTVCVADLPFR